MKVKCPRCGKQTALEDNSYWPFCSERCKLVDLGHWLSDSYSITEAEAENLEPSPQTDRKTGDS
jgi:endogenous inhibitor of DNA gyrase (YacG/DUF329 family)